jgi:hypothetical protein
MNTLSKVAMSFLTLFLVHSCQETEKESNAFKSSFSIVLLDTFDVTTSETIRLDDAKTANYAPLYIGEKKDTIKLDYSYKSNTLGSYKELNFTDSTLKRNFVFDEEIQIQNVVKLDSCKLKVEVDPRKTIKNENFYSSKKFDYDSDFFNALPITVQNQDKQAVKIGNDHFLNCNLEYLADSTGKWHVLDHLPIIFCGTGVPSMYLYPKQIAITSIPIIEELKGERLRIRLGNTVSNEFSF